LSTPYGALVALVALVTLVAFVVLVAPVAFVVLVALVALIARLYTISRLFAPHKPVRPGRAAGGKSLTPRTAREELCLYRAPQGSIERVTHITRVFNYDNEQENN